MKKFELTDSPLTYFMSFLFSKGKSLVYRPQLEFNMKFGWFRVILQSPQIKGGWSCHRNGHYDFEMSRYEKMEYADLQFGDNK